MALRATPSVYSTTYSPFEILFASKMRVAVDEKLLEDETKPTRTVEDYVTELLPRVKLMRQIATDRIREAQEEQKRKFDRENHAKTNTFRVGDRVLLKIMNAKVGVEGKLQPKYIGPYYIEDALGEEESRVFEICNCETHKPWKYSVNQEKLKKYHESLHDEIVIENEEIEDRDPETNMRESVASNA